MQRRNYRAMLITGPVASVLLYLAVVAGQLHSEVKYETCL